MNSNNFLKNISYRQLRQALFQSQILFFLLALLLSFFLFDHITDWLDLFSFNLRELIYYGILPAILIILFNLILKWLVSKDYLDDGGINEKLFKNSSVFDIIQIAFLVAICEELLFRGLIQTVFGLVFASLIFAFVHFRYLKKPVLLISVVSISFYIGILYEITGNLLVTISVHFIVDLVLGLLIRFGK